MAKPEDGSNQDREGKRSQSYNPKNNRWVKRDAKTGRFIDQKADKLPFKGVKKDNKGCQNKGTNNTGPKDPKE